MTWLLAFLVLLLILPPVVERMQFAITRGRQRAKAEVARVVLKDMPESTGRFAWVVKSIEPSVVGIETSRLVAMGTTDEWSYLYPQAGEGSGVIVDDDGHIVTNYHVIDGAQEVTVKLADGRTVSDVRVVGADPPADLAVLKIDSGGLTAAPWGRSESLEVGEEVLAIGNPYRFDRTVTAGIISAKDRQGVVGELSHQEFLQTDAAVNPGNSGGPLVNMKGEVIGINTAIFGRAYQGISFAIPSDMARETYRQLRETGKVKPRGWLGVTLDEISELDAARFGLERGEGVRVKGVVRRSPADRAGIEPGDVILRWNGQEIDDPSSLSLAVVRTPVGSEATVELIRGGQPTEIAVRVGERPAQLRR
jgi:serine protease Do